jgi:hypothetical protein
MSVTQGEAHIIFGQVGLTAGPGARCTGITLASLPSISAGTEM